MAKPAVDNNTLLKIQKQVASIPPVAIERELQKLQSAARQQPRNPAIKFAHGLLLSKSGDQRGAIGHLTDALKLAKNNELILSAIAYVYAARLKEPAKALKYLDKKLKVNPRDPATQLMMANCQLDLGEAGKALKTLERAEPKVTDKIRIHGMKSRCYLRMGDSPSARKELLAIAKLDPTGLVAVGDMLAGLPDNSSVQTDELEKALSVALKDNPKMFRDDTHRSMSAAALGNIHEAQGNYEKAFEYFQLSNDIQPIDKLAAGFRDTGEFEIQRTVFTSNFLKNLPEGHPSGEQVFVLGMPRSGTTLVESILDAHRNVEGFGELEFFPRQLHAFGLTNPDSVTIEERMDTFRKNLEMAPLDGFMQIGEQYIESNGFGKLSGILKVDKMPLNFRALGLISIVFPNAKIVHTVRHPMDTCLSLFKNPLRGYHTTFANSLDTLGSFYIEYTKLMRHWKEVLPLEIHDVRYEDMVHNTEHYARELITFLELDWDEACLKNRKAKPDVNTASVWQVRQDIYSTSVQKWRIYENQLKSLEEALADEIQRYENGA